VDPSDGAPPADAILLDFGGTLDADGVPWARRFHRVYRELGGRRTFESFEPAFRESDRRLGSTEGIGRFDYTATVRHQSVLLTQLLDQDSRISPVTMADWFLEDARRVIERNRPVLERLAPRYRLGVVSNFTGNLVPCLEELGIAGFFKAVLDSAREGMIKPDAAMFRRALERLGTPADRAWMVGDNFEADIRPALALGMRAAWLAPVDRTVPQGTAPCAHIQRLIELEGILAVPCAA